MQDLAQHMHEEVHTTIVYLKSALYKSGKPEKNLVLNLKKKKITHKNNSSLQKTKSHLKDKNIQTQSRVYL